MSKMITKRTVCSRDCPDACSILVDVKDGVAQAMRGDPEDPVTRGFLCERTSRFLTRQNAADRFLSPMLRVDGELQPIGWDEALDLAANKLLEAKEKYGPASILSFRSGGSLGMLTRLTSHLLSLFGPVTMKSGDICSGAGEAAQVADMGISESHDFFDTLNSKLVVLWGKDVHTSSVHLLPVLKEVQARGGRLVGLDVRATKLKSLCDTFSLVSPGGDLFLALGLARHLFDTDQVAADAANFCDDFEAYKNLVHQFDAPGWAAQADVDVAFLRELGDALIAEAPVSFQIGWGLARRKLGATTVRAIDALSAISGNLGVKGGGASFFYGRSSPFDTKFGFDIPIPPRRLPESLLGQEILAAKDPGIHVVWITAANPVSMLPDSHVVREALASRDFVVAVETHPTDTTDVADLVLPTLTLLEDDDIMGAFGNHFLRASTPVVDAPENVWHELKIVQGMADRLGLGEMFRGSVLLWKEKVTESIRGAGLTLEELGERACKNPFAEDILFAGQKFPTKTGRFQLLTEIPACDSEDNEFPLRLLATSSPKAQSSQWSVDPKGLVDRVRIHPAAAGELRDGDRARLESSRGTMEVTISLDANQHPQVVAMPKGGMFRQGACPNSLVRAVTTDAGGGAAYYDEPVRLVRLGH